MSSISDDTDRPFWGEDELSSSESTQQLHKKQKRRYTLSHRNSIAVHKSRSSLFQSSSSSLNSISEEISSGGAYISFLTNILNSNIIIINQICNFNYCSLRARKI